MSSEHEITQAVEEWDAPGSATAEVKKGGDEIQVTLNGAEAREVRKSLIEALKNAEIDPLPRIKI